MVPVMLHPLRPVLVIEIHPQLIPMPGHGDIGEELVHAARGEDVGAVDGRALRLVDGDGVAVVEAGVALWVKGGAAGVVGIAVETDGESVRCRRLDGAQQFILHAELFVIAGEDQAIAGGEGARAGVGGEQMLQRGASVGRAAGPAGWLG